MNEIRACAACGANAASPLFRELVQCRCGLVYYPHRLTTAEIQQLYGDDYFHGAEYCQYLEDAAIHRANFRSRINDLARWLPPGQRLFEIGCAYGLFLDEAKSRWQVAGCDISPEPIRHASDNLNLDVRCGEFLNLPMANQPQDAVVLWDVIEHLDEPDEYLARSASLLAPGGLLALTTGDIGSWLAKRQGPRWRQIHPPTHLWYFDRVSIAGMLDRLGFDVIDIRSVGVWRSIGQILHGLEKGGPMSRLRRWCERLGLGKRGIWLNTFDLMRVIARKRNRTVLFADCNLGAPILRSAI